MSHQGLLYNHETITDILNFVQLSSPAPNPIDNTQMVFYAYLVCSAVAFIAFLFFIPSLAYTLTSLPLFTARSTFLWCPLRANLEKSGLCT